MRKSRHSSVGNDRTCAPSEERTPSSGQTAEEERCALLRTHPVAAPVPPPPHPGLPEDREDDGG